MASSNPEDGPEPRELLGEVLDEPERGKERLPYIVGLFDSEERTTRLYAAWTCCVLANELDEDAIEYMVRRLTDRLDDTHVSLELTTTLDYISTRHSKQVGRILEEIEDERQVANDIPFPAVGGFTRSHYYSSDTSRDGIGRTHVAGSNTSDSPRRAYPDREREKRERDESEHDESDGERDRENAASGPTDTDEGEDVGDKREGGTAPADATMAQERTEISAIATRSRFDNLHILATRQRDRYADVYDALVARRGEEMAVALRLVHQPSLGERPTFADRVSGALRQWTRIDDHDHVVRVLDWGIDPRPWLATGFTRESLAEQDAKPGTLGLAEAVHLADAVSYAHQNGVVHGGIDPRNVVYPGDVLASGGDHRLALLDNVALMSAFRFHFEPSLCLDPRYAAPEYYRRAYGRIDHATDIYQLGAVLYRLFTGTPPFSGDFEEVRESVLSTEPVPPSERTEGVPSALDDIISKAMAKQKLTRYETVEHLQQELVGLMEETDG